LRSSLNVVMGNYPREIVDSYGMTTTLSVDTLALVG